MIGLTDTQLRIVMSAARLLPVEERDTFFCSRPPCWQCAVAVASPIPTVVSVRYVRYLTYVDNPAHAALRLREW